MKKLFFSRFTKLFFSAFLIALSASLVSCGDDDDKVDCDKLQEKAIIAAFESLEASSTDDCEGIEDAYADIIKIAKQGKSCDFVKEDMMDAYGVDNIGDLEDALLAERDELLDESDCND